jgi:hypothetical protein
MFPDMWSRGIAVVALCVTCVTGALAALPAPAGPGLSRDSGGQDGLMQALELAPQAVAQWKRAHDGHAPRKPENKGRVKSRLAPFRIRIFAGSLGHGHLGDPAGRR